MQTNTNGSFWERRFLVVCGAFFSKHTTSFIATEPTIDLEWMEMREMMHVTMFSNGVYIDTICVCVTLHALRCVFTLYA